MSSTMGMRRLNPYRKYGHGPWQHLTIYRSATWLEIVTFLITLKISFTFSWNGVKERSNYSYTHG